jgi:protein-disulfide isomerase
MISLKGLVVAPCLIWIGVGTASAAAAQQTPGRMDSAVTEPIQSIVSGEIQDVEALLAMASGVERGDPNAPITVLEFGDFQCPACQQFALAVKPQIDAAYVDEGVARFTFRDFPLVSIHAHAFIAARAARCALDQGGPYFWAFHDRLYEGQATWAESPSAPTDAFVDYAASIGLDAADFANCLDSDRHADVVSANMRLGFELGVGSTPTLVVSETGQPGFQVSRWNDFGAYQSLIERLLAEAAARDGN